jgi:hypothetical protein
MSGTLRLLEKKAEEVIKSTRVAALESTLSILGNVIDVIEKLTEEREAYYLSRASLNLRCARIELRAAIDDEAQCAIDAQAEAVRS